MFSMAETSDVTLMVFGSIGAIVTGMSIPMSNVLFGRILDALNKNPGDQNAFSEGINVICVAFVVLGAINIVTGIVQVL